MIRSFTSLCKLLLLNLTDEAVFHYATNSSDYCKYECLNCGAIGKLSSHGDYKRNLVLYTNRKTGERRIKPLRFKCNSCKGTHALLPDILVPYSPYSLRFMLIVLIAYYERNTTVIKLCERFKIAVSTLYEWKKRMLGHKDLMLGMLKSLKESALVFLKGLLAHPDISSRLNNFFNQYGFSFMQTQSVPASRSRSP
jgi:transposase-like protein